MRIESIHVYRVRQPLIEPYYLSYGAVHVLDSVWVRVESENGAVGWGESTPLPGYSETDLAAAWETTTRMAGAWVGQDVGAVLRSQPRQIDGFTFTALWSAIEEASGSIPNRGGDVPLVGLVQERAGESPAQAVGRMRQLGYRIFKIKAGFLPEDREIERLDGYQNALANGERVRIDANQSLSEAQARRLLEVCSPDWVEMFEQPLPIAAWDACARLATQTSVALMLDESITDVTSLRKTAQTGAARVVKLKWMKQAGKAYLDEMIACADELGLKVVLGNGVAGAINNRHEAIYWLDCLRDTALAGEMNGYLKLQQPDALLGFANGHLRLLPRTAEWEPELSEIQETAEYLV